MYNNIIKYIHDNNIMITKKIINVLLNIFLIFAQFGLTILQILYTQL